MERYVTMSKAIKKVCDFLGAELILAKESPDRSTIELETELLHLSNLLQLVLMDGTTLYGGNDASNRPISRGLLKDSTNDTEQS